MKEKNFRIIFFTIIIILIFFAIYLIIKNKDTMASEIKIIKRENQISNEITIGITKFDTINPILSNNQDIQYISKLIYEPLINIGQDFKLEPDLATEWSKLDDKTYLIRLSENKYWHNGEKFKAKDVEYTINYIKQEESIYDAHVENIEYIEIINDYTIKLYLIEPEDNFEYMLCFPIVCEKQNIGTGNFYVSNINEKEIILQSEKKKINIKIYEDVAKLYNAFSQEVVDVITTNNINFEEYIGTIGYSKKIICNRNFDYVKFNVDAPEVVQALCFAINKNEIIYKVYNNLYCRAEFPLQYGCYLYNDNIEYVYNINKAKQILKEGGWEYNKDSWRKNGKSLRLEITTNQDRLEVAEIIKQNLEEIGIKVSIRNLSNQYYKNNLQNLNYDILLTGNIVSIKPEVQNYLNFNIEQKPTKKETYENIYKNYKDNPNFMGLYFDSTILLYSSDLKGNFESNWFNIFYNIDSWYKIVN